MGDRDGAVVRGRMNVRRVIWAVELQVLPRLCVLDDVLAVVEFNGIGLFRRSRGGRADG